MDTSRQTAYETFEASSDKARRLLKQEGLILAVTEAILEKLDRRDWTQRDLAKRLGRTRGYVSQLLTGRRNMTLRTLADLGDALGCRPVFWLRSNVECEAKVVVHPSAAWVEQPQFEPVRVSMREDPGAPKRLRCLP